MLFSKQFRRHPRTAEKKLAGSALKLPARTGAQDILRVATYNIHKGVSGFARTNRIHELRLGVHALDADLLFLQEVQGRNDRHARRFADWPIAAQHDYLATAGWTQAVYGRNAVRNGKNHASDHGNALLSRFPLLASENLDVSDHRFESRGLLHCEVRIGHTTVHCLCAHLGLFEDSRHRQAEALIARIDAAVPADAPLIIAGDFNDWRNRLGKRLTQRLGVREVFEFMPQTQPLIFRRILEQLSPARTFPSILPLLRMDRIYVRGFAVRHAEVLHGGRWQRLSDHAPIVADLVLS